MLYPYIYGYSNLRQINYRIDYQMDAPLMQQEFSRKSGMTKGCIDRGRARSLADVLQIDFRSLL
jgi:hypothetical protein